MSKTKFELNRAGVAELMKSSEMMGVCRKYADKAVNQLGNGYKVSEYTGKTRVNVSVSAQTYEARKENSQNNTILKAVYGQ